MARPAITALQQQLGTQHKVPLASYPTPLEKLERLSAQYDRPIWIKRDDTIGPGLGGNKTRKLEYLLAPALASGRTRVVTFGGLQSNHARITAAAARKLGLEAHLFYFDRRPETLTGNLLLNDILGASMHFIPYFSGGDGSMRVETTNRLVQLLAALRLGRHTFIPVGGHSPLGCLGYVEAALELEVQAQQQGLEEAVVITAVGTGGTLAGLWAGFHLTQSNFEVLGLDIGSLWKHFPHSIAHIGREICALLDQPQQAAHFQHSNCPIIEHRFAGHGYAKSWGPAERAIQTAAAQEGLILDPIYTAKAFAGMLDLLAAGSLPVNKPVIFLHTGGAPALMT